ncbi:MAG: hypothetical protein LIV25_11790 [Olsenella sp.]|nr:hypothetical protein [Olsenella sp.]
MKHRMLRETLSRISPKLEHDVMFRHAMGEACDLENPRTFNEKISWLKLYELPKMPLASEVTDKYRVRGYVEGRGHGDLLVGLYGHWDNWDKAANIDFDALPEKFVLKCNHGCGMNILCHGKAAFDREDALYSLNGWMGMDWGLMSAEPHYSAIEHQIICEQLVEEPLSDFKFYCFGGESRFFYVSVDLDEGPTAGRISFFNMDGTCASFTRSDHRPLEGEVGMPSFLAEMADVARDLAEPFKFVRIDFMVNPECYYFSEVTLTPCAGMMPIEPKEWDLKLGEMLEL